jgi:gluconate 2-dehydrogenase alpha chain
VSKPRAADVVIIGLGAAGGVAAEVLTAAGLEVIGLEAGPRLDASDARFDEIDNVAHARLSDPKAKHEVPTWRFSEGEEAGPSPWPMLMVNAVGGTTVHYEGLSIRFLPYTFRSRTAATERYGSSAIPAQSTLVDWPLDYDELEPFYNKTEHAIGVAGVAGGLDGARDPDGNAFEGPRSGPYPMEPLRPTGWSQLTSQAASRLGWHPFAAPSNINSTPYDGRPACTFCGFCMHNVCYCDAKGAAHLNVIKRAEDSGRLQIETAARALRIEVDGEGRACGVTYVVAGEERYVAAKAVLVATFTYENVRLLLLSKSPAYPAGLSNNHGQVGRHYIAHYVPFVFGAFPGRRLNLYNGVGSQVTGIDDWNGDNFDHSGLGFLSGGLFLAFHEMSPIAFAKAALPPSVPRWGGAWKAWISENAQSVGSVQAQFDALPYEFNYLDLDPSTVDPLGVPVVRVTHRVGHNEERGAAFLAARLAEWLTEAGATETWTSPPIVEARHCYGGTRMGHDPQSSVVDAFGFSHEVPNLGVLGASTFPTAGGHNPTLTVQALSWRTAARLVEEWGAIAGA